MPVAKNKGRRTRQRQRPRSLEIEIRFLEGLVKRDPDFVEAWEVLGDNYLAQGRAGETLEVDERLCQLMPSDARARYNLACSLVLTGQFERAVRELEHSLDLGFDDFHHLSRDPELDPVRKHPHFERISARLRAINSQPA